MADYVMDDDEIKERMQKYKMPQGQHLDDVFGMATIFVQAGISPAEGYSILSGKKKLGARRRLRISRAIIMAETGMIRKVNGRIRIGEPTRAMPPRMKMTLQVGVPKLEYVRTAPAVAEVMPTFKQAFGKR